MKDNKLPHRQYTREFMTEAMRLAASVGNNAAARRLGMPVATLSNWCRAAKRGELKGHDDPAATASVRRPVTEVEAENSRLRRELAEARLDVEILRKATAYFVRASR